VAALEKDPALAQKLAAGAPFSCGRLQVFVSGSTAYAGGRVLYQCVGMPTAAPGADLSKS